MNGIQRCRIRNGLQGNKEFSMHHLLPQSLFPDRRWQQDNIIPLNTQNMHKPLHKQYTVYELAIDPLTPIIKMIEFQIKHYDFNASK